MNRNRFVRFAAVLIFGVVLLLLFGQVSSAGDNWYEETKPVYRDPYSFNETYMHLLFPNTGVHVGGNDPYLYAILSKAKRDIDSLTVTRINNLRICNATRGIRLTGSSADFIGPARFFGFTVTDLSLHTVWTTISKSAENLSASVQAALTLGQAPVISSARAW